MKRNSVYTFLLATFFSLFASSGMFAQNVAFKVQNVEASPGNTIDINVVLENSVTVYSTKFLITLPTGMSFVKNSNGDYGTVSSTRKPSQGSMQMDVLQADNQVSFGLVSTSQPIQKNSGTLVTFKASIPAGFALGSYPIKISSLEATNENDDLSDYITSQDAILSVVKPSYVVKVTAGSHGKVAVSPTAADNKYVEGTVLTMAANPDEGYEFTSWSDGSTDNPLTITVSKAATYTAKFSVLSYKVNFIVDGKVTTQDVNYGAAIKAPTPTKAGYTFSGWDQVIPTTMPARPLTFTAQWKINSYTLTYVVNGKSQSTTLEYGAVITAPAAPTRDGYTFAGWDKEIPATMPAENLTITALWKVNGYTLTFDLGTEKKVTEVPYGEAISAPTSFKREGYTFVGWDKKVPATMPAEPLTITAIWKINQYKLNFVVDDKTITTDVDFGAAISAPTAPEKDGYTFDGWDAAIPETMPARDLTFNVVWKAKIYRLILNVSDATLTYRVPCGSVVALPASVTRTGYTFAGWDAEAPATMPAGDLTLTALWNANSYKVTYNNGNEQTIYDVACGAKVPEPEAMTKEGYIFAGWDNRIPTTMPAENLTFNAQWKALQYSVTFIAHDEVISDQLLDFGSAIEAPEDPVREGYEFTGWDPTFVAGVTVPVGGAIYRAIYKVNPYFITYIVDGEEYAKEGYVYGEEINSKVNPEKEGYRFLGWDKELPATMPAEDLVLTAQWEIAQYTLTFKADDTVLKEEKLSFGATITAPEAPVKEGYTFTGWTPTLQATMPAEDLIYTALYTVNTYKVSYYFGEELLYEEEIPYGSAMPDYTWVPSESYIIFNGWQGDKFDTMPAHDVVYHADYTDGMSEVKGDASQRIYNTSGVLQTSTSLQHLPAGVYVIGGKKVIKK